LFVPSTFDVACEKSMRGVPGYESRLYGAECPSPHYASLLAMYASMHRFGYEKERGNTVRPGQAYVGATLRSYAGYIKRAIQEHGVETVLDYGAGKGANYEAHEPFRLRETGEVVENLKDYWGVSSIVPFEPALGHVIPEGKFDCVVSTDALEHVFLADVPWVVEEMFRYSRKVVFVTVSCRFANARLPNGEQAHVTLRPPWWWAGIFHAVGAKFPEVDWRLCCDGPDTRGRAQKFWFARDYYDREVGQSASFAR